MLPDEMNERELVDRLASLKPAATAEDPRIAFYNMGFAAGSSCKVVAEQSKHPREHTARHWLTTAAAVAACTMLAFVTGYSFRSNSAPHRVNIAAENSRLSVRERSVERTVGGTNDATKTPLEPKPLPTPTDLAYPPSRAALLSAGWQDRWSNRELTAYGVSKSERPVLADAARSSSDQKTFVSTLTRMDYLKWEDAQ